MAHAHPICCQESWPQAESIVGSRCLEGTGPSPSQAAPGLRLWPPGLGEAGTPSSRGCGSAMVIHRNICTACHPATHLVDPGGVVTDFFLHSEASHYVADIACSDELQIEEDSRNFFAIILHDHGVLIHSGQS